MHIRQPARRVTNNDGGSCEQTCTKDPNEMPGGRNNATYLLRRKRLQFDMQWSTAGEMEHQSQGQNIGPWGGRAYARLSVGSQPITGSTHTRFGAAQL